MDIVNTKKIIKRINKSKNKKWVSLISIIIHKELNQNHQKKTHCIKILIIGNKFLTP